MHLFARLVALLALSLPLGTFPLAAQDCASNIKENKKISGIQFVQTTTLTIIVRGNYNYAIEYFTNEKGIFARMVSVGGIEFNQDDQVVFVDASGNERAYRFMGMDELVPGSVPTHRNNLRLDLEAVQWLSESNITGINFINFVDRQKHKFTTNPNLQSQFRGFSACFYNILDAASVKDTPGAAVTKPTASTSTPASGGSGNKTTTGGSSSGSKPSSGGTFSATDGEVTNLKSELEKTKERLREEIKAEKDRADAIKAQLQAEVAAAREAANAKKLEYANEVVEARKQSLAEIEKSKAETQSYITESRSKAENEVVKINQNVEEARKQAGEDIHKARLASAEEVKKARENAAKEVAEIKQKLEQSKLQYGDEIATARTNADDELKRIREENARIVADARERGVVVDRGWSHDGARCVAVPYEWVDGTPAAMCTSQLIVRSLLPTFGAPPSTSRPPGVSTRGAMMSSGIGLASSSSAPSVKVGISLGAGAALSRRTSGGPFFCTCRSQ
ncbi:MAG TPA: cell envelope integrity protein TolA, partial [Saprospiraceae bacterium]|nr:cell envelope integrity protein TolA [Saprospiraceae bacterium]